MEICTTTAPYSISAPSAHIHATPDMLLRRHCWSAPTTISGILATRALVRHALVTTQQIKIYLPEINIWTNKNFRTDLSSILNIRLPKTLLDLRVYIKSQIMMTSKLQMGVAKKFTAFFWRYIASLCLSLSSSKTWTHPSDPWDLNPP